jgi:hypothetical protein
MFIISLPILKGLSNLFFFFLIYFMASNVPYDDYGSCIIITGRGPNIGQNANARTQWIWVGGR